MGQQMEQTVNSNPQADVEGLWMETVVRFLDDHYQSELLIAAWPIAVVFVPGMDRSERHLHLWACLLTVGLWVPVFAMISILKTPKIYLIDGSGLPAGIWTWELDV
jgi:hypothetical protein